MMIGILVGFIVGYFAEARSKPDKALERARPKKPPDKVDRSKMPTRLIVTFGFAIIAILSSSVTNYQSFNSVIPDDDIKPPTVDHHDERRRQTNGITSSTTRDTAAMSPSFASNITVAHARQAQIMHLPESMLIVEFNFGIDGTATKAIESVVSSDAIKEELVLQEYVRNSALDLAFKWKNEMPPAKSITATKHGYCFIYAKIKTDHAIVDCNTCRWLIVAYPSRIETIVGNAHEHFATVCGSDQFHAIIGNAHEHSATVCGSAHSSGFNIAIVASRSSFASEVDVCYAIVRPATELIVAYNAMPCNGNIQMYFSRRFIVEFNFIQIPAFLFQERTSFRKGEYKRPDFNDLQHRQQGSLANNCTIIAPSSYTTAASISSIVECTQMNIAVPASDPMSKLIVMIDQGDTMPMQSVDLPSRLIVTLINQEDAMPSVDLLSKSVASSVPKHKKQIHRATLQSQWPPYCHGNHYQIF